MGERFEFREAFPPIRDVIEELCERNGEATHDAIVRELIKHKTRSMVVENAIVRCPGRSKESIAGKMVQWLSQQYTVGRLHEFEARFKRRKINQSWAYSRREA